MPTPTIRQKQVDRDVVHTTRRKFGYRSAGRKARAGETPALRMVLELTLKTTSGSSD